MPKEKKTFICLLRQFAFAITYRSGRSAEFQILIWICEKLFLLSSAILYIFSETPWDSMSTFFYYIKVIRMCS